MFDSLNSLSFVSMMFVFVSSEGYWLLRKHSRIIRLLGMQKFIVANKLRDLVTKMRPLRGDWKT